LQPIEIHGVSLPENAKILSIYDTTFFFLCPFFFNPANSFLKRRMQPIVDMVLKEKVGA
jgi:hypothetical protein